MRVPQVLLLLLVLLTNADAQTLPAGAGPEVILARCVSCHDIDLITAQRLSGAGWTREVDKMVRWGATVSDAERATLQSYLVANFGPTPVVAHGSDATGAATYARACLVCDREIAPPEQCRRVMVMVMVLGSAHDPLMTRRSPTA